VLPRDIRYELFDQCILPKLENSADEHALLPWIVHIPLERLRRTLEMVCHRLCRWCASWNFESLERLRPWKTVLRESEWASIMGRLKKRLMELPERIQRDECGELAQTLFTWAECWFELRDVLDAKLFNPFLNELLDWLEEEDCDYKRVLAWLKCWRSAIPKRLLETPAVEGIFTYAFQVMKHYMTGGKEPMPTRRTTAPERGEFLRRSYPTRSYSSDAGMNMKDVLEEIAGEQDISMVPTKHKSTTNKQLYTFGKTLLYWEGNVVYCQQQNEKGKFEALPLAELLKIAR